MDGLDLGVLVRDRTKPKERKRGRVRNSLGCARGVRGSASKERQRECFQRLFAPLCERDGKRKRKIVTCCDLMHSARMTTTTTMISEKCLGGSNNDLSPFSPVELFFIQIGLSWLCAWEWLRLIGGRERDGALLNFTWCMHLKVNFHNLSSKIFDTVEDIFLLHGTGR